MIRPLIDRYGSAWLERSELDLRFKAPAYDDDAVEARFDPPVQPAAGSNGDPVSRDLRIRALNDRGEELISMTATFQRQRTWRRPDPRSRIAPIEWEGERVVGTYDLMAIDRPFRAYRFSVGRDEQREYCRSTADEAPLYLDGARAAGSSRHRDVAGQPGGRQPVRDAVLDPRRQRRPPPAVDPRRRPGRSALRADREVETRRERLGALLPGLPGRRRAGGRGLEDIGDQGGAARRAKRPRRRGRTHEEKSTRRDVRARAGDIDDRIRERRCSR